jgi:DNA repair protein RadA
MAKKIENISDLPGIGETAAKKLFDAGFKSLESIAVASAMELKEIAGLGDGTADKAIKAARDALEMGFESADILAEKRKLVGRITTGSEELDSLIGGGIETQSITEVYGKMASGKSQWCFQTAVTVQLPKDQGGLEGGCLYIDSENSFRPERVTQVANRFGLDVEKTLKNIYVARAYNADHQMLLAEKAGDMIKEKNIKLLIVDSLMAQFRAEYVGRGTLSERQQKINKHLRVLQKLSEMYNITILVTNQVMSRPDILFGDPTAPVGGNVVGHATKTRLYLRKSKEDKRVAKLVDSPSLPDGEALYRITENGIEDV